MLQDVVSGTTQFINSEQQKVVTRDLYHDVAKGLNIATDVGYTQEIEQFLQKPVIIGTAALAAQAAGVQLFSGLAYGTALGTTLFANKVSGYLGFRATAEIRLQINANRFQAGRLIMAFVPQGNITNTYPGMRTRSLRALTQLPRVELDLATESEVTMEIPYISPAPYYNLISGEGELGRVYVYVYSPLATGAGSTVADITVWCSFKDVQLVTPAVAQMSDRVKTKSRKKMAFQESESEAMGVKPISGTLSGLAHIAKSLSSIPVLSPLATPAAWVMNTLSGVASSFGYAKPSHEGKTDKVQLVSQYNMQNDDGFDFCPNMGLSSTNKLTILPGFAGTNVDEMALNHLVQIPAYWQTVSWSTTNNVGDILLNFDVDPMLFKTSATVNLWGTVDAIPLSFFQGLFQYWRGSIVLIMKIVKTPYHSGRFQISYNPGGSGATSQVLSDYVMRDVVDISDKNEFRFVIPYAATAQYKRAGPLVGGGYSTETTGSVTIRVLNALVAPDTVDTSIQILLEVCAGPDYEMMCPRRSDTAPIVISGWSAQMNDGKSKDENSAELLALGSAQIQTSTLDAAQYCVGEKCNSVLQLLKRFSPLKSIAFNASNDAVDLRAFVTGACYSADLVGSALYPTGDLLSIISPCFGYSRGSMRYMVLPQSANGIVIRVWSYPSTNPTPLEVSETAQRAGQAISIQNQPGENGYGCANVPPYQQLHSRLCRFSSSGALEPVDQWTSAMRVGFTSVASDGNARPCFVYRAVGDDFTLGFFLGVPLVTAFY